MDVSSIRVEKYKKIKDLDVDLGKVTLIVGGNNAGKSSFLQAVHYAITALQSANMAGGSKPAYTLGVDQFIYKPSIDLIKLYSDGEMSQTKGSKFSFRYRLDDASEYESFALDLKRGKNANISLGFDTKSPFYTRAADYTRPLSIFVPGLSGVALREEKRTNSILYTGAAQGDCNLYLRNVLHRILNDSTKLDRFHGIINSVFPGLRISSQYNEDLHQFIDIAVKLSDNDVPLEMVGTGCLQAIQMIAYTTMYDPTLLLLDEPDSHLHPSNQRLLASTLEAITDTLRTKIIVATHSRHMFDALSRTSNCKVVWLKDGQIQPVKDISDLSILMDLGALDSFEMVGLGKTPVVVLTEDDKSEYIRMLLKSNGFKDGEYYLQPYYGVDNISSALPVAEFFTKLSPDTRVIIHRDGDCMLKDEKKWVMEKYNKKLPERSTLFITTLTDVEHAFCQPEHIAKVYDIPLEEAKTLVLDVITRNTAQLSAEFANKRSDLKARLLRKMEPEPPSATKLVGESIDFQFVKGKSIIRKIRQALVSRTLNGDRLVSTNTDALKCEELEAFAKSVWAEEVM